MKPVIAVSGKNGQVGWELQQLSSSYPQYEFIFCDRNELDITNTERVSDFFQLHKPSVFINCSAYTAVDKAETEQEEAYRANAAATGFLASQCSAHNTLFVSFSTDYVFNGNGAQPYREDDPADPVNYYGYTKFLGEQLAMNNWKKTVIIRTSWVYSEHGHNFVKTMLRLLKEKTDINVVNDQLGSPTYAKDIAEVVLKMIASSGNDQQPTLNGIYHFSNDGIISWFDFALEIKRLAGLNCHVHPIPAEKYPTPARRPHYSGLDKSKIISEFGIELKNWKESLAACMLAINKKSGS